MVVWSFSSPSRSSTSAPIEASKPPLGFNVAHLGNIFEGDFILGEDGRGHAGQRGVLRAGDANGANQRIAAANYELIHSECRVSAGSQLPAASR